MKVYESLSNSDYHALTDYVSSSFVKGVAKHSIAKALQPIEPSQALLFGDAMHTYFEDRQAFHKRFKVFKDAEIIAQILERRPDIMAPLSPITLGVFRWIPSVQLLSSSMVLN